MEITLENARAAYNAADKSGKKILKEQKTDDRPITERIKTFEDACKELGKHHTCVMAYRTHLEVATMENFMVDELRQDVVAYLKLRIICAALNDGWEPQFTEDETRHYPWFWLYTENELNNENKVNELKDYGLINTDQYQNEYVGFAYAYSSYAPPHTSANFGSRLCLKTAELARYCGTQFSDIWADFNLIRK